MKNTMNIVAPLSFSEYDCTKFRSGLNRKRTRVLRLGDKAQRYKKPDESSTDFDSTLEPNKSNNLDAHFSTDFIPSHHCC